MKAFIFAITVLGLMSGPASANVCNRSPQIVENFEWRFETTCDKIPLSDLAKVTNWIAIGQMYGGGSQYALKSGDFNGMTNLAGLLIWDMNSAPADLFQDVKQLYKIAMQTGKLTMLPDGLFSGLKNLHELNLSFNEIASIPDGMFDDLSSLEYLFLVGNKLTELNADLFKRTPKLKKIWIGLNSFSELEKAKIRAQVPANIAIDFEW